MATALTTHPLCRLTVSEKQKLDEQKRKEKEEEEAKVRYRRPPGRFWRTAVVSVTSWHPSIHP
jgi:hypothetical protein